MKVIVSFISLLISSVCMAQDVVVSEQLTLPMRSGSCDTREIFKSGDFGKRLKAPLHRAGTGEAPLRYIDRISNMPDYLIDLYNQYSSDVEKALKGEVTCLVNPMQDEYFVPRAGVYAYTVKVYEGELSFTFKETSEVKDKALAVVTPVVEGQWDEFLSFIPYVCCSMNLDHPEAFWLNSNYSYFNSTTYGITYNQVNNTGKIKYEHNLYFAIKRPTYDLRRDEFLTEEDVTDGMKRYKTAISNILADYPDGKSRQEGLLYLNEWLTTHNAYCSILSGYRPTFCYSPLSALEGTVGVLGPVCEGYARALKVLCDQKDIPCVLQTGMAQPARDAESEDHMWNYVQLEDGQWYAIDVTWNDPVDAEDTHEAASGLENHNWFLLGSETQIWDDFTFIESHPENPSGGFKPQGSTEWDLIPGPALAAEGIEIAEPEPTPILGDIDGDGIVTVKDITELIDAYLSDGE